MSYQTTFEAVLDAVIKENHNQEITGPVLNAVFKALTPYIAWKDEMYFDIYEFTIPSTSIDSNGYAFIDHNLNSDRPGFILYDKNGDMHSPANDHIYKVSDDQTRITLVQSLATYTGLAFAFSGSSSSPQWTTVKNEDFSTWSGSYPNETLADWNFSVNADFTISNDSSRLKVIRTTTGSMEYRAMILNIPLEEGVQYRVSFDYVEGNYRIWFRYNCESSGLGGDSLMTTADVDNFEFTGVAGKYISLVFYAYTADQYAIIDNLLLEKFTG